VSGYLRIEAGLPRPAALELAARLEAGRPLWDIELTGAGFRFFLPLVSGSLDEDLTFLEEGCRQVERIRGDLTVTLDVTRAGEPERDQADRPAALGPWPLAEARTEGGIALPPEIRLSRARWAGESLLAGLVTAHLTPPPGAPVTRGRPVLSLAAGWSLAPLAALAAGSGPVTVLAEEETTAARIRRLADWNGRRLEVETGPFAGRRQPDRAFGLILIRLSPYLAARRLRTLARWLAPDGVILAAGFAPGLQTAHLLRSAIRAGLVLETSDLLEGWAAARLSPREAGPELPPLTGSVIPTLFDWFGEEAAEPEAEPEPASPEPASPEPDSLMVEDGPEEEEE
jgi:hypothetical protein